jgi:hypothetical protein
MGTGPAGLDPPGEPRERAPTRKATQGRHYDIKSRDYPLDSKGRAVEEHPVDTWVKLQLAIAKGSIEGDPEHGNDVASIEHITRQTKARVENMVRELMQPKVATKEIQTLRIDVMTEGNRIGITYEYTNLVTGKPKTATA